MKIKLRFKGAWEVIKETFKGFSQDKVSKLSGSLAYFTIFSMGPLLVVIISLCGLFFAREAVEGKIYSVLRDFVGQDTAVQLQDIIRKASIGNKSTLAAIIGTVTLLLGATGVFGEIQDSINKIWGLKPKPKRGWVKMLKNRILSFSVIISLGFLLLVSLAVTGIIESINHRLQVRFPEVTVVVFYIINLILTIGISVLIFAVIFKVLPDAKIDWKDVMAGSVVTSVLFLIGKFGISFYISQTKVGSTYGAAGSLVVLLVWVYYSSIILYLGAEFTKAYAIKSGKPIYPADYAVTTKEIEVESDKQTVGNRKTVVQA
ncbi:MAG: YihY/virulence factor BrkB family protein [Bacteroidota bacterium]